MLEKEYKYYKKNKKELLEKYNNKFIVIKNDEVIGAYSSEEDAYNNTIKTNKLGTFLIKQCLADDKEEIQTFHSRVAFSL
ncbi:hypothetical protein COT99_00185 [Candidatus Falkowbacteria bacterium CG10_big_fil_rev_8_21_14_0_10_43_10]|uniref:DUF5678 domain-containing protein n=1 Tax=Candidatus Falkowbacteria bacterium CG10_big_fil_rev_8_21_14_0_10_43_10 TaxID=1974567 RepID=A0A2H0V373_9BACT|nr:MAG: hypothetical protein COT99_00185 [Candidatus Falkowbacteria bacterium CG10_big_fil_rev_8_21_14_0_10_43_10]